MSATGHVLIAPDKFKGSLTASAVAGHLATGLARAIPGIATRQVPVADGGDGTLDAALAAGFSRVPSRVTGPTGLPVDAAYAERDGVAVVELAKASGLGQLPGRALDPLWATSYGTGELVRAALDRGCHRVVLGLGGSACTDGGAGMLQALGMRLRDSRGHELSRGGAALAELDHIDATGLRSHLDTAEIVVASDVDNPLLGPNGAAEVYGPQKGADPDQVARLGRALARWAEVLHRDLGPVADRATEPSAGAAGGVGFAAMAALHATVRPGIDYLLELVGFPTQLAGASVVLTGEGSLDKQTLRGKAPAGVAAVARRAGIPVIAVAGRCLLAGTELAEGGFATVYTLGDIEPDPARCHAEAGPLLERLAAERLARDPLVPVTSEAQGAR
ncbi:glycerate kinase [Haloechinothrix sp. LS1_15]|uniref:glycerate kinase n=1 Tax=Haloechinothrix sp. LS1_15 TaxID=2652248 RepID=UPI002945ABBC|nr:glycerate kinase [Haloechinothrix sp. LS1_15]MDV6012834.1 glycerate kinase [Haloechinothrix sp. LS1_15]